MILLGFTWFLGGLAAADNALVFTAGILLGSVWGAVLAHVLFSFPSGRLPAGPARALVIAAYVLVPLAPLPAMLFSTADDLVDCGADCPENLLLVEHDEQLSGALLTAGALVLMILCLLAVWLLVKRWRAAGPAERRSLAPLFGAGAVTLAFVFANAAIGAEALYALTFVALAVMPFAFLAGLVRADLAQARGVRSLVARLADLPDPGDLRSALAAALGDPTLRLAFWVPEQERYVDEQGAAVELPAGAATEIERDGRRIAAIIHDPALAEDAGDRAGGGGGDRAAAREPAPGRRAAGQHARAARFARADRRGRGRRTAPARAQPPRRGAGAARGALVHAQSRPPAPS